MDYRIVRQIEHTDTCEIFEIEYGPDNIPACLKILNAETESRANLFIKEAMLLSSVQNDSLSLKYYKFDISIKKGKFYVRIITEYCEQGNLEQELMKRKKRGDYFSDEFLETNTKSFVNYFEKLQQKEVSHRDLKPGNIFMTQGSFRVGDFGCSTFVNGQEDFTIAGSPMYLSPELREGYELWRKRVAGMRIVHCPFKSDVYSLGLILMYMTTLIKIDAKYTDLENLEEVIKKGLEKVKNNKIKKIIKKMLEIDSNSRPDFIELNRFVKKVFNLKSCFVCENFCESLCNSCETFFHYTCTREYKCPECQSQNFQNCSNCGQANIFTTLCEHNLCEKCAVFNVSCKFCIGFQIIDTVVADCPVVLENYPCLCGREMELENGNGMYFCNGCNIRYCALCKERDHFEENCIRAGFESDVICKCRNLCSRMTSELFFLCQKCAYRCYVCMKNIETSHLQCAGSLELS